MTARLVRHNDCEVIVIGAGPYGLAAAAHLKASGIETRVFGEPMSFWRCHMPKGMFLRSPWGATDISDPGKALLLDAYIAERQIARTRPLPLETFVDYGSWFQARAVPDLDRRMVERIEPTASGFRIVAADGEDLHTGSVVVAMGLARQAFRPVAFAHVSNVLASHSCDHADFAGFRGRRVAIIGRGQSACESAALLHEAGAEVDIVCRSPIHWLGTAKGAPGWRARIQVEPRRCARNPVGRRAVSVELGGRSSELRASTARRLQGHIQRRKPAGWSGRLVAAALQRGTGRGRLGSHRCDRKERTGRA